MSAVELCCNPVSSNPVLVLLTAVDSDEAPEGETYDGVYILQGRP